MTRDDLDRRLYYWRTLPAGSYGRLCADVHDQLVALGETERAYELTAKAIETIDRSRDEALRRWFTDPR